MARKNAGSNPRVNPRDTNRRLAANTSDLVRGGVYSLGEFEAEYSLGGLPSLLVGAEEEVLFRDPEVFTHRPSVDVRAESTLSAIHRLREGGPVVALNFASATRPGGGWRSGAVAQEETLARASTLGVLLEMEEVVDFYREKTGRESIFYTDDIILSPEVFFFRDDSGKLIAPPVIVSVLTCAAPNLSALHPDHPSRKDLLAEVPGILLQRARRIVELAWECRPKHLILGAWGCGVFGNDLKQVAKAFADALVGYDSMKVTFAILGPWSTVHDTFREVLKEEGYVVAEQDVAST